MKKYGDVDLSYYEPINDKQKEFHSSKAKHKLLIGGVGGGKTYPAIHEALFMCFDNPNNQFLIARNTWDSLVENVEREFLDVAFLADAIKKWHKTKHDLILKSGTTIKFRPLTLSVAQFKGFNGCGFYIDDPDVERFHKVIGFLYSRLRNPPRVKTNYFSSIITANWEGRNWLWQKYMREKDEGGNDKFAYWVVSSLDNPTLPEDYVEDLASTHSQAWLDRYVYCKMDQAYIGLVYNEYDPTIHDSDLSWCFKDKKLIKILAIDVGITDPTVVLKIATDYKNMYIYDEWYHTNIRSNTLGEYLTEEIKTDEFKAIVIDPSSAKKEQTSGTSVKDDLRVNYHINTMPGNNDISYGIETIKTLLTVKDKDTHLYIDPVKCPNTINELEIYRWVEPSMSEIHELAYKEKPRDRDNHCMDPIRYGSCYFKTKHYLRSVFSVEKELAERRKKLWEERYTKLKMYSKAKNTYEADRLRQIHYNRTRKYKVQKRSELVDNLLITC